MTRIIVSALACVVLACGGDTSDPADYAENDFEETEESVDDPADEEADEHGNRAPLVDAVKIVPTRPKSGDTLTVTMKIFDPENDRVDIEVDWYANGKLVQSGSDTSMKTTDLRRGDQVYAEVVVSDGLDETYDETEIVMLENQSPKVRNARLVPAKPTGADTLLVEADAVDPDGDNFEYSYTWFVNGEERPEHTGASLAPRTVKRGDKVQVAVKATDGGGESAIFRTPPVEVSNSLPKITSKPAEASVSAGRYTYQLAAEDPDGDQPLRFSLVNGPAGLDVDLVSGLVSWDFPDGEGGKYPIVVSVADAYGGRSEQDYTLELSWSTEPANADEGADDDTNDTVDDEDASEAR